jgi:hypothetical protein
LSDQPLNNLATRLSRMTKAELMDLARQTAVLERRMAKGGPKNDDELWQWIKDELGIEIPRVAVCEGHTSPFQFIADLFFERVHSAIAMANRGGSKTFGVALLHYLNGEFKPKIEMFTFGATEAQAQRAYAHFKKLVLQRDKGQILNSLQSRTMWKNGAELEIQPGTMKSVNGPHPQIAHADEVDLMDVDVYYESRNMAQSKVLEAEGRVIPAQDILTSTRKSGHGLMQQLMDEIAEAKLNGREPPFHPYVWCIFETAAQVKNCQVANPDLPDDQKCDCHNVVKGRWENESERSLRDVCGGRLFRSRGWITYDDVKKLFRTNTRAIWEAQQTCQKPSTEGLVVPQWSRERHGIVNFKVDPENGPIYQGIDFGGTNPHAVLWFQILDCDIEVTALSGATKRLKQGTYVFFDEIYKAEIGNTKLAKEIKRREATWRSVVPYFRVKARHPDPQGKAARQDLRDEGIQTIWNATRDIKEHIKLVTGLVEDDMFAIDINRCEMTVEEIESWHYPRKRAGMTDDPEVPVSDFDHTMSAMRYGIVNTFKSKKGSRRAPASTNTHRTLPLDDVRRAMPAAAAKQGIGPTVFMSMNQVPSGERWRFGLGGLD